MRFKSKKSNRSSCGEYDMSIVYRKKFAFIPVLIDDCYIWMEPYMQLYKIIGKKLVKCGRRMYWNEKYDG